VTMFGSFLFTMFAIVWVYLCILLSSFAGAHVNTKDEYQWTPQWTPLHYAAGNGNLETAKVLLEKGEFTFFSELSSC